MLITHGWPGSIAEFVDVIGPLADPARHGGDPLDAFDVIAPSMPGYGFSDHPRAPRMDPERIAATGAELMTGLGYERFAAQGGDWGARVTTYLGARHPGRVPRHTPQHDDRVWRRDSAAFGRRADGRGAGRPRPRASIRQGGERLPADSGNEAANPLLRAERFARRARRVDHREIPGPD
ncbi:MAG: alpha/beta fold hydrolase [Candidatus Binatia bacterium]